MAPPGEAITKIISLNFVQFFYQTLTAERTGNYTQAIGSAEEFRRALSFGIDWERKTLRVQGNVEFRRESTYLPKGEVLPVLGRSS
jgi:hypothetical protein